MQESIRALFDLSGRVAVITGGGGLLGEKHAEAIALAGGTPVLVDIHPAEAERKARLLAGRFDVPAAAFRADITRREDVEALLARVLDQFGTVDILINNASN